jgi:hypothetical protein
MLIHPNFLKLGLIVLTLGISGFVDRNVMNVTALQRFNPSLPTATAQSSSSRSPLPQLPFKPIHLLAQSQSGVAALSDGTYQFCSQPDPADWRDGAGVCFNFNKVGDYVEGYYGYPHSDDFICVRGSVDGSLITGEALAVVWAGSSWEHTPDTAFTWDAEGHLTLDQGDFLQTTSDETPGDESGQTNWVLFHSSLLNVDGFYQYSLPRMVAPSILCDWSQTV